MFNTVINDFERNLVVNTEKRNVLKYVINFFSIYLKMPVQPCNATLKYCKFSV